MFIKGIKRGRILELLEYVNLPDNHEALVELREVQAFWPALHASRQRVDLESIDDDTFKNLRDKSPGKEINL